MIGNSKSNADQYIKSLLKSFLAICGLILLIVLYHIIVYAIDGGTFKHPVKVLRTLLAFVQKQHELKYLLFITAFLFLLINFIPEKIKKAIYPIFIVIAYIWVLYRIFNLAHIYYAGTHIGKDFLYHIEKSSLSMILDIKAILFFFLPIPVLFLVCLLLKGLDYSSYSIKLRIFTFLSLSLLFYILVYFIRIDRGSLSVRLWMSEFTCNYANPTAVPEKFLFSSFEKEKSESTDNYNGFSRNEIALATIEKFRKFGVFINPEKKLPLSKEYIFKKEFPFPKANNNTTYPNIIIFAVESLSAKLLGYYGATYERISPNINEFAKESLVIRPFYNSTTPTINGLASILCSYYPVYGHEDWTDSKSAMKFDLLCLPEILKEKGYHSYNVVPGDPYFAKQLPFMKANDMDEIYGALEIKEVLNERPLSEVFKRETYSDQQVMRFLIECLKNHCFKEPFTITISTVDLHPPFRIPEDCKKYPKEDNPILHLVHNVDTAFGLFWQYFKNSSLSKNTIVILTADHAMFPGVEYRQLIKTQDTGFYDEVPFVIYDPVHELPRTLNITSSAVDILPSLLHLLNINIPNSFEGLSVFDPMGRARYPDLLGAHDYLFFYRLKNKDFHFNRDEINCGKNLTTGNIKEEFTSCDYFDWWKYKRWLQRNNLIWKEK